MQQYPNMVYTEQAMELNPQLQIKRIKGLKFRVIGRIIATMNATYGLYIEGKGFLKFKNDAAPISGTKKFLADGFLAYGLVGYETIEFVNPINA